MKEGKNMNIQETFEFIESREKLVKDYERMIIEINQSIKEAALKLLKDQHGIEVGSQYSTKKGVFKLSKIESTFYKDFISYTFTGHPTKKDGKFSKREQYIDYFSIYKKGTI